MRVAIGAACVALVIMLALAASSCGYIKLPGGLTINFPGFSGDPIPADAVGQQVKVPEGFHANLYAAGIENARLMVFTDSGDLIVSAPRQGKVFLVSRDANGDGVGDGQRVLLEKLYQPHGLALHAGWLYVAETTAVKKIRFDEPTGTVSGTLETVVDKLPDGGNHWTRTVGIGPDEKLYVSIGSSCNVCIEEDSRRAALMRYDLDGGNGELYATGLRNAVDFDWQPDTGVLYATDNGRDLLGDDFPPCELNRVVEGGFYGWPIANGDRVPDPDYGAGNEARIAASIPPAYGFVAHTAPLGMTFYEAPDGAAAAFPERYDGAAFVALHGSWNRSRKSGYEVLALRIAEDGTVSAEPFVTGLLVDETVYGRPVDAAVGPDGALYVSDDFGGQIYRVAYGDAARGAKSAAVAPAVDADPLAAVDADALARANASGAALWNRSGCAACHVKGQAAGDAYRPLEHLQRRYDIDSLAAFLRTPQPPMPVYPFSDDERRAMAIYLLAAHP